MSRLKKRLAFLLFEGFLLRVYVLFFFLVGQDETIFTKVHSGWKNNETSKGKSVIKYNLDILILRIPLHPLIWFHHASKLS